MSALSKTSEVSASVSVSSLLSGSVLVSASEFVSGSESASVSSGSSETRVPVPQGMGSPLGCEAFDGSVVSPFGEAIYGVSSVRLLPTSYG